MNNSNYATVSINYNFLHSVCYFLDAQKIRKCNFTLNIIRITISIISTRYLVYNNSWLLSVLISLSTGSWWNSYVSDFLSTSSTVGVRSVLFLIYSVTLVFLFRYINIERYWWILYFSSFFFFVLGILYDNIKFKWYVFQDISCVYWSLRWKHKKKQIALVCTSVTLALVHPLFTVHPFTSFTSFTSVAKNQ